MCSNERELWSRACHECSIDDAIASRWLKNILDKYDSEAERIHHNSKILQIKSDQIIELNSFSSALIFAIFFQYYHFNVNSDCGELNRNAFRLFCTEANWKNVSNDEIVMKFNFKLILFQGTNSTRNSSIAWRDGFAKY